MIPIFRARANGRCWIYLIRRPDTGAIKVGIATDVAKRFDAIQCDNDVALELLGHWRSNPAVERNIHHALAAFRKRGEWFEPSAEVQDWLARQLAYVTNHPSLASQPGPSCTKCGAALVYAGRGRPPERCNAWPDCSPADAHTSPRGRIRRGTAA